MQLRIPPLHTERVIVREYRLDDLPAAHHTLHRAWHGRPEDEAAGLPQRRAWMEWSVRNFEALTDMSQPPYGDRAVTLADGTMIGSAGLVPAMGPFAQLVDEDHAGDPPAHALNNPEVGLYWAIDPEYQKRGYATEAGGALIRYAFEELQVARIIATTEYDNLASQAVMRKLGMRLMRNPYPHPVWFQVVGVLENMAGR